jgi:hypothetical protein
LRTKTSNNGRKKISNSEKRWLVREIESGRMTVGQAKERIEFHSKNTDSLIHSWRKKFTPAIRFTLLAMTPKKRNRNSMRRTSG